MPAYDAARFDLPSPLASVVLRNAENGATLPDVPMLIGTGADVTLVPQSIIQLLGITGKLAGTP